VEAGRSWDLADAIAVLRLAQERRETMAKEARAYARTNLSATVGLQRLESAVSKVVTSG
jgi:hypothetical protein